MKIFVVVVNEWVIHEYDDYENVWVIHEYDEYENVSFYLDEQKANAERDRLNN